MKKLLIYLALAFSLVTLAACGKNEAAKLTSSTNNHQSKIQGQVTLILKTEKSFDIPVRILQIKIQQDC